MRALRFTEFGTRAEALASAQVALPPVTPDESLVQVHAAGINPSDVAAVAGRFGSELPAIPGRDFAGVVVPGPRAGEEVWGTGAGFGVTRPGAYAEYVAVPAAFNGGQRERVGPSTRGSPAMCVRHCETAMSADLIVSVTIGELRLHSMAAWRAAPGARFIRLQQFGSRSSWLDGIL
jgi:NADPH:quinone reductase-like Zn-dependent oxidoreductase